MLLTLLYFIGLPEVCIIGTELQSQTASKLKDNEESISSNDTSGQVEANETGRKSGAVLTCSFP